MKLDIYQVDAFTKEVFKGNPAAICPLENWLDAEMMQKIALENNLSETAFLVKKDDVYEIRWFTPTFEIDLCGHATLASAFVIFEILKLESEIVKFHSHKSGELPVEKKGNRFVLDFPSRPVEKGDAPDGLIEAIGKQPKEVLKARDYFLVFETEQEIADIAPNFSKLLEL
ncbi:MAG: PhzF family phenazine biosynthesis protein, partial [Pyrinomonadaceae bacterium]